MNNVDLIHFEGLRELPKDNEPVKYKIRLSFRLSDEFADAVRKISQRTPEDLDKSLLHDILHVFIVRDVPGTDAEKIPSINVVDGSHGSGIPALQTIQQFLFREGLISRK